MEPKTTKPLNASVKAVIAMALAWTVPGAGHAFLGRPIRGVIIFLAIGAIFWAGVAMGGVMTVDHKGQKWWFAAQMLTGVHGLVGWQRETQQMQKLQPLIKKKMEQGGASLLSGINENRNRQTQYNQDIARLRVSMQTAASAEERQMCQDDIDTRLDALGNLERDVRDMHRQLYNLQNNHIHKVLADEKLALVAPMATLARAYAGVAGLLNLMCMFDVVMLSLIGTVAPDPEDDKK
jgi:hypothetical protein